MYLMISGISVVVIGVAMFLRRREDPNKCTFCAIVSKRLKANVFFENDEFMAFHDIHPAAKVHLLLIPKQHFRDFEKLPSSVLQKMRQVVWKLPTKMFLNFSPLRNK